MLPYMAFVLYFSRRFPSGHWPPWLGNTILIWFVTNFLVLFLLAKKMFKAQGIGPQNPPGVSTKPQINVWIVRILISQLLLLWSFYFLQEVKETVQGKLPMNRAIPAGAFLLFFIAIFGWGLYRSLRPKV
jgi:hypothetical protein